MGFRDEVRQIEEENLKMPPLLEEVKNLMGTVGSTVSLIFQGKNPILSRKERERRLAICMPCKKYNKQKDRCTLCGCNMPIKSWLKTGYCKLGKFDVNSRVSVMIASYKEKYLDKTINNISKMAKGQIEILTIEDEKQEGRRVLFNRMARLATGKYLYIVDAHCRLTKGWDTKMKKICGVRDLVVSKIDDLDEKTWNFRGYNYGRVYLDNDLVEKWWKPDGDVEIQETMGMTGCSFMLRKKRYWELGGYTKELSRWGSDGPEWALKIWLSGGRCLLHTGVTCGHLFKKPGEETHKIPPDEIADTVEKIQDISYTMQWPRQIHNVEWLVQRFSPVPTWDEESIQNMREKMMETQSKKEVVTRKRQVSEVKDDDGKVVKKVIKLFKGVKCSGEEHDKDPTIRERVEESTEIEKIRIATLQEDESWGYRVITDPEEIKMWLFEND